MNTFESVFEKRGGVTFPKHMGIRIMMMPVRLEDPETWPDSLKGYQGMLGDLVGLSSCQEGTGYLTVDERILEAGETMRRPGRHVDGVYRGGVGGWAPEGPWAGGGMLTASNVVGCMAWRGRFEGAPGDEGGCDHLRDLGTEHELLEAGIAYWLDGLCVHESLPMKQRGPRSFVRLSMPSDAPWFEGYTENPLGVKPNGKVLGRRDFMDN